MKVPVFSDVFTKRKFLHFIDNGHFEEVKFSSIRL
jgi:hypothetical protein